MYEKCVTGKRKRKRTQNNRFSGCDRSVSIPPKMAISLIASEKSNPIIRFLDKISTNPTSTNISDMSHPSSGFSNCDAVNVNTRAHSKIESREHIAKNISNDVPCHTRPCLVEVITKGDFSTAENILKTMSIAEKDINEQDMDGNTPLMLCCITAHELPSKYEKCLQIMKLLLKNESCSLKSRNHRGMTALILACAYTLPEYVEIMLNDTSL